ncbi:MAG TPA: hypothetical protein VD736_07140 [Nitrososphaera sp.]|nr:hypothetical protein [Nitrososphaera sp.]
MESSEKERILQIDMAMVQLVTTILVTLGSTLVAISIGFGLTMPSVVTQAVNKIAETDVTNIPNSIPSQTLPQDAQAMTVQLLQESLNNYVLVLAVIGFILIAIGILYSSAKITKMKKSLMGSLRRGSA